MCPWEDEECVHVCRGEWKCVHGRMRSVCMCAGESEECVHGRMRSVCICVGGEECVHGRVGVCAGESGSVCRGGWECVQGRVRSVFMCAWESVGHTIDRCITE